MWQIVALVKCGSHVGGASNMWSSAVSRSNSSFFSSTNISASTMSAAPFDFWMSNLRDYLDELEAAPDASKAKDKAQSIVMALGSPAVAMSFVARANPSIVVR